jgi:hypothetical protein
MADPVFGEGSAVSCDDGANSAFVDFDDVIEITPPAETQVVVDRNRLSVTTLVERAFSTRKDPGQFSFSYERGYTKYARIETLKADTSVSFRITDSDTNLRLAFTGRVISNVAQPTSGGAITMAVCTVQLTSLVTVSDASP